MKCKNIIGILVSLSLLLNMFPIGVNAAISKPLLQIVTQPKTSYNRSETITFTVNAPNYGGKVEYRVILYNGTTKKTTNLWNTSATGYYYRKWQPAGTYRFAIKWSAAQLEPGAYSLTVLVRRANTNGSYDSFVNTRSFYVTGEGSTNYGTITVGDYSQYYAAIKNAVLSKQSKATILIKNFNSTTYNVDTAIRQAIRDGFSKYHTVSSWNYNYTYYTNSPDKTLNLNITYDVVNGYASTYDEFVKVLRAEAMKRARVTKIKILKTNSELVSKQTEAIKEVNLQLPDENKIEGYSSYIYEVEGSNVAIYEYTLTYKDTAADTTTSAQIVVGNQGELDRAIQASLQRCDTELQISFKDAYVGYTSQDMFRAVQLAYDRVTAEDYDLNFIKSYYIQGSELSNIYNITFTYRYDRETALRHYQEALKKAEEVIAQIITPGMSDLQKEIAIHNYIVNNTKYDKYNYDKNTVPEEAYNSYGVFVKGVAVCEGYANAMSRLLNLAGIENMKISGTGNGSPHAWNLVKLEGSWYHIDATWDDPIFSNDETKNALLFDYFNLTDVEMSKDHTWDSTKYPKCTETKYRYTGN